MHDLIEALPDIALATSAEPGCAVRHTKQRIASANPISRPQYRIVTECGNRAAQEPVYTDASGGGVVQRPSAIALYDTDVEHRSDVLSDCEIHVAAHIHSIVVVGANKAVLVVGFCRKEVPHVLATSTDAAADTVQMDVILERPCCRMHERIVLEKHLPRDRVLLGPEL